MLVAPERFVARAIEKIAIAVKIRAAFILLKFGLSCMARTCFYSSNVDRCGNGEAA